MRVVDAMGRGHSDVEDSQCDGLDTYAAEPV